MRGSWTIRLTVSLAILGAGTIPALAQQQTTDSVAEAARKAREQRKDEPKPKKVYTDDDVSTHRTAPEAATGTTPATAGGEASAQQPGATAQAPAAGENTEAAWRKRFQEQRDKIATAQKELDILQRELDQAQVQYYPDPQKALMQQNNREDINKKTAKIEEKKQEIARLQAGLDDLESQLRKAGGDPGWAR